MSNLALERMNNLILERFKEVEVEVNGKMEKLETNEAYEEIRLNVHAIFDDLTKGLKKLDKVLTKKEFADTQTLFNLCLEDLFAEVQEYFDAYISAVYAASKSSLK